MSSEGGGWYPCEDCWLVFVNLLLECINRVYCLNGLGIFTLPNMVGRFLLFIRVM